MLVSKAFHNIVIDEMCLKLDLYFFILSFIYLIFIYLDLVKRM